MFPLLEEHRHQGKLMQEEHEVLRNPRLYPGVPTVHFLHPWTATDGSCIKYHRDCLETQEPVFYCVMLGLKGLLVGKVSFLKK